MSVFFTVNECLELELSTAAGIEDSIAFICFWKDIQSVIMARDILRKFLVDSQSMLI